MTGLTPDVIHNLGRQCENLKPGTEEVIKITKKELDEQLKKVIKWAGCDLKISKKAGKLVVTIVKKKKESDSELLAGLGDLWTWPVKEPEWMKQKEKQVAQLTQKEKQLTQKEKQLTQKDKQLTHKINKVERLVLMNPTRVFWNFAKDFDKNFNKWDYDKLLKKVKKVKKAITGYPVDEDDYNIWIKVYKNHIIPKLERKIENINNIELKNKLKEILNVIKYIIENTKTKNIWLS